MYHDLHVLVGVVVDGGDGGTAEKHYKLIQGPTIWLSDLLLQFIQLLL